MPKIPDVFQARYLKHQKRKRKAIETQRENKPFPKYTAKDLAGVLKTIKHRRSRRIFGKEKIEKEEMQLILKYARYAPSSCNRKAVKMVVSKKGIENLVGGRGWIEKADKVILFYADMSAYKSPAEVDFMPYLDTGFMAQNIYLICEVLNIACCFCNPNGWKLDRYGYRMTGAMALGKI